MIGADGEFTRRNRCYCKRTCAQDMNVSYKRSRNPHRTRCDSLVVLVAHESTLSIMKQTTDHGHFDVWAVPRSVYSFPGKALTLCSSCFVSVFVTVILYFTVMSTHSTTSVFTPRPVLLLDIFFTLVWQVIESPRT